MGCWNHTCALTNLPVFAGEPVYTFLLENYGAIDDRCYSGGAWGLYPFHFTGKYNDYGAVEYCEGKFLPYILSDIKESLVEFNLGSDKTHDIIVKKEDFDIDLLFDADHEGRLYVYRETYSRGQCENRLSHIVIKKEVLDTILSDTSLKIWKPEVADMTPYQGLYTESKYHIDVGYEFIRLNFYNMFTGRRVKYLEIENQEDDANKPFRKLMLNHDLELTFNGPYPLGLYFQDFWMREKVKDAMSLTTEIEDDVEAETLITELAHQVAVYYIMASLHESGRRSFQPTVGAGSQNEDTTFQTMLAKITLKIAEDIKTRRSYYEE